MLRNLQLLSTIILLFAFLLRVCIPRVYASDSQAPSITNVNGNLVLHVGPNGQALLEQQHVNITGTTTLATDTLVGLNAISAILAPLLANLSATITQLSSVTAQLQMEQSRATAAEKALNVTASTALAALQVAQTAQASCASTQAALSSLNSSAALLTQLPLPKSCLDYLLRDQSGGDGLYVIYPPSTSLNVWCDMTTCGGGWTLIYKTNMANTNDRTEAGYNIAALQTPLVNDVAVLPSAIVNQIGSTFRVSASQFPNITVFWSGLPWAMTGEQNCFGGSQGDGDYTIPIGGTYTVQSKNTWTADWISPAYYYFPCNANHSVCVGPSADLSQIRMCVQRWCCSAPNAGLFFGGGDAVLGYYAGTGWVR